MNRLQYETSPYLLQHASNPVDWYAWKSEAFEKARREDKPIVVSIGYSTCHWCHVMERESFEDSDVAAFMNEHFVNIKVDREERPDVDQIYMEACQAISGSGGWPLNCFLTPDGRPFYAGTYYPPRPAHNRPSWMQVLINMYQAFRDKRQLVEEQADRLVGRIQNSDSLFVKNDLLHTNSKELFTPGLLQNMYSSLEKTFDRIYGGFGGAPKFPGVMSMDYLLVYYHHYREEEALKQVVLSLEKMIRGGIYDQLGGGFARYATDSAWLIPHFEKMLYDNALLVGLLSDAYTLTQNPLFKEAIVETLSFVKREMTNSTGGFYAALDADSEGEEGKFYVWDKAEVNAVLGEEANLFCAFYDVGEQGNWEGKNILWRKKSLVDFAEDYRMEISSLQEKLASSRAKLFAVREKRIRPGRDEKVILAWNALQCTAYAKAYLALGEASYLEAALKNLQFIFGNMQKAGAPDLFHTYALQGETPVVQYDAFLDDYAFLIEALLAVYQITFDEQWLTRARQYTDLVLEQFNDTDSALFFYTREAQKDVILRKKELYDSAQPSGNSTMAVNLLKLAAFSGLESYRERATEMLKQVRGAVERYPSSFSRWAFAMSLLTEPLYEIAIVGPESSEKALTLQNRAFLPNKVLMASREANEKYPLLADRQPREGTLIFVCQDYACQMPVEKVEEALKMTKAKAVKR